MNILREARKKLGLTQEKAADLIGVSKRTLIRWEMNHNIPDLIHVPVISKVYGITIEDICLGLTKQTV